MNTGQTTDSWNTSRKEKHMKLKHQETIDAISAINSSFALAHETVEKIDYCKNRYSEQVANARIAGIMQEYREAIAEKDNAIRKLAKNAPLQLRKNALASLAEDAAAPAFALLNSGAILKGRELLALVTENAGNRLVSRAAMKYMESNNIHMNAQTKEAIRATCVASDADVFDAGEKNVEQLVSYLSTYGPDAGLVNNENELRSRQKVWKRICDEGIIERADASF